MRNWKRPWCRSGGKSEGRGAGSIRAGGGVAGIKCSTADGREIVAMPPYAGGAQANSAA